MFLNNRDILMPLIKEEFYKSFPALSEGVDFKSSALHSFLGDIAALSLVMPEKWIGRWQKEQPWKSAPEAVVIDD